LLKKTMSFDDLLEEYRLIWNNRILDTEGNGSERTLFGAIKRELKDENSHPRTRKNMYEKYYSAIKRVIDSTVSEEAKLLLIKIHNQVMEELVRREEP
jgi:DNA polymerase I-like protein with 3'-5' exonuclease and polymerase domains